MTLTYEDIRPYVEANQTAQEITDSLNAVQLHFSNAFITGDSGTDAVNFLHLLTSRFRVMWQNRNQSWVGPLPDLADTNPQVGQIMGLLYPYLQVKDSIVYCGESEEAAYMVNAISGIVGGIVESMNTATTNDVIEAVKQLTGGRKYINIQTEEVQNLIDQEQLRVAIEQLNLAKETIRDGVISPKQSEIDNLNSAIQVIRNWINSAFASFDNSDPDLTIEEYQTLADNIAATPDGIYPPPAPEPV